MIAALIERATATSAPAWAIFVRFGVVELVCGLLILVGLATRAAAVPLMVTMLVAIVATKVPIWLGRDWWIFHVADFSRYGFWSFLHETRTDWAMLMGSLFLLAVGAGPWSLDAKLFGRSVGGGRERVE